MTTAQVVKMSVTVTNTSFQNYTHPDDHTRQITDTPGFKPFTITCLNLTEIFSNHVRLSGHILSNAVLQTTNHWLTGYHDFRALVSHVCKHHRFAQGAKQTVRTIKFCCVRKLWKF